MEQQDNQKAMMQRILVITRCLAQVMTPEDLAALNRMSDPTSHRTSNNPFPEETFSHTVSFQS